ncbi:MAG: hypothetical protein EOP56_02960 [Sphingobacteriales bacterium]|nr:MAG: hypothetical protein EOP56_02960 [Sphingobacteriales bacterium]
MKLSKMLLGAIVAGITVQTLTSCSKNEDKYKILPVKEKKAKTDNKETINNPDPANCPACGMG